MSASLASDKSSRLRNNQPAPVMTNGGAITSPIPRGIASATLNMQYLPTPTETLAFSIYPALLVFGSLFSVLSPETRAAPYDPVAQAHVQDASVAPSYFARKGNIVNQLFVKKGWAWMMVAFVVFAATNRAFTSGTSYAVIRRAKAVIRFGAVTMCWIFVTQWFFGPALIDRGFRYTGGRCDAALSNIEGNHADVEDVWTAVACKAAGGKWKGGHDISGHVFLLVLGSGALLQEVGWVLWRAVGMMPEERCIVMPDGAVKSASIEAREQWQQGTDPETPLGVGAKFAIGIIALSAWMVLMTAIYFHTWFEKLTGLIVAFLSLYMIYILPRWTPALRSLLGIPGI